MLFYFILSNFFIKNYFFKMARLPSMDKKLSLDEKCKYCGQKYFFKLFLRRKKNEIIFAYKNDYDNI